MEAGSKNRNFTVHVGTHKTGTTSVQEAMREHRDWLAARGVNYLQLPECWASHNAFGHALATADAAGLDRLRGQLAAAGAGGSHAILSSEEISARIAGTRGWDGFDQPDYWERKELFLRNARDVLTVLGEVRLLICFRRHEEYAMSLHATNILSDRFRWSLVEFVERCHPLFDYASQLAMLRWIFPGTDVASFDAMRTNLIRCFCDWARIPALPGAERVTKVTPNMRVIEWLRLQRLNTDDPALHDAARHFALSREASERFRDRPRTSLWPDEAARSRFLARCVDPAPGFFAAKPEKPLNPVTEADLEEVQAAFAAWRGRRYHRAIRKGMGRVTSLIRSVRRGRSCW
jgi:hypothetical protein